MTEDERLHQTGNAMRFDDDDRSETVEEYDPDPAKAVAEAVGRDRRTTVRRFEQVENQGTPIVSSRT